MVCEKCSKKPIAKGIKFIKCLKCGREVITNVEYILVCKDCCEENNTCEKCGISL